MKSIKSEDYFGVDANDISLFEHGLLCHYVGLNEYEFIYKVWHNDQDENRSKFDTCFLSVDDIKGILSETWFDLVKFVPCYHNMETINALRGNDYSHFEIFDIVSDMVSYYGYENIFGSSNHNYEYGNEKDPNPDQPGFLVEILETV